MDIRRRLDLFAHSDGTPYRLYVVDEATSDIENIETVDALPAIADGCYNLQGIRISRPAAGSVVVIVKNGKALKTVIR